MKYIFDIHILQLVSDDKYGEWQSHLAIILANRTERDLDYKFVYTRTINIVYLIFSNFILIIVLKYTFFIYYYI